MTSHEYTKAILPIIRLERTTRDDHTGPARHLRYLLTQALYGYEEFAKKYMSRRAQAKYKVLGFKDKLVNRLGRDQKKFDRKGKQKGDFFLDHVFTLKMFRNALDSLSDANLSVEGVERILGDNYAVAWILRTENEKLNKNKAKSHRGETLAHALEVYRCLGIELLNGG